MEYILSVFFLEMIRFLNDKYFTVHTFEIVKFITHRTNMISFVAEYNKKLIVLSENKTAQHITEKPNILTCQKHSLLAFKAAIPGSTYQTYIYSLPSCGFRPFIFLCV